MIRAELNEFPNLEEQESPIERAKGVLRKAILVHEKTLTDTHPYDRIGEFSAQEIREAALTVFHDLVVTHPWDLIDSGNEPHAKWRTLKKINQWYEKSITLSYDTEDYPFEVGQEGDIPRSLIFNARDQRKKVPNAWLGNAKFPLTDLPSPEYELTDTVYFTEAGEKSQHAAFHIGSGDLTLARFKSLWRGSRWLFANMLNWDSPNVFSFEQLDALSNQREIHVGSSPVTHLTISSLERSNQ